MPLRHYAPIDQCISQLDKALRVLMKPAVANRPYPAQHLSEGCLTPAEKNHASALMRVNHAGEISAQGLYQGQAITAKNSVVREQMEQCANEEIDHLNWCQQRIDELGSHTSYFDPVWYVGSFLIGTLAGFAGDRWSLGFVEETERQVVNHLNNHHQQLAPTDVKTAAVIEQIRADEVHHAQTAQRLGAYPLPKAIRWLMKVTSKVMTVTAYRL